MPRGTDLSHARQVQKPLAGRSPSAVQTSTPRLAITAFALSIDNLVVGYVNGPVFNAIAWITAAVLILLTILLVLGLVFHAGPAAT